MITFLIVLIAILVICCCIMLYLYFSVRKEADNYEYEYRKYTDLYTYAESDRKFYHGELDRVLKENIEFEKSIKDKDSEIKLLRQQVDNRTINYTRTTVAADDVNSNIIIPREIFKNEDPIESSLFYKSTWNTLVDLVAKDILSDSTRFFIEYDISSDRYRLHFYYKKFLSKNYRSDGYRINAWSESPVKELVERMKQNEKGDRNGNRNN